MDQTRRTSLAAGVILILLGALFLTFQAVPQLRELVYLENAWPLFIVAIGVFLLILGLLVRAPGMAVPASIVAGIGCLLYWQNYTGNWESWAYAWALIPGFVGIGIILTGLLGGGNIRSALLGGGWLIFISLMLFFIFGSFLGGMDLFGVYWPVLLIVLGVLMLLRPLLRLGRRM
jgi:hypothetical protein